MTVAELIEALQRQDPTRIVAVKMARQPIHKAVPIEDTIEVLHLGRTRQTYHCVVLTAGDWP